MFTDQDISAYPSRCSHFDVKPFFVNPFLFLYSYNFRTRCVLRCMLYFQRSKILTLLYDNILTILVVTSSCTSMLTISLKDVLHFSSLADFKRSSVFKLCHIYRSLSKKPQTSMSFGTHFPRVWSSTALVFHCVLFLV